MAMYANLHVNQTVPSNCCYYSTTSLRWYKYVVLAVCHEYCLLMYNTCKLPTALIYYTSLSFACTAHYWVCKIDLWVKLWRIDVRLSTTRYFLVGLTNPDIAANIFLGLGIYIGWITELIIIMVVSLCNTSYPCNAGKYSLFMMHIWTNKCTLSIKL